MTSMNVSLPEELKEYVEAQTKSGYSTPSEYVRELIREDQKRRAKERLDTLLLEGLNSGKPIPVDAKFWSDLKQEALAKLESRKKHSSKNDPAK
jgi:antitoxin ParD1/3/4